MKRQHDKDQHFLRDPSLVAELIGHSNLRKNDAVYDLGAGSGIISSVLSRRVKRVIAVENEPATVALLEKNMRRHRNVDIVRHDIERVEFPSDSSYKIFSNIPFSLSSRMVERLVRLDNPPRAIYLIVQKQFARKLLANHTAFTSQLGMRIAPWWTVRIRRPLRRTDFWPHPNVDTVLLELKPREEPMLTPERRNDYECFVERMYSDPKYFNEISRGSSEHGASQLPGEEMAAYFSKTSE